jgi:hypothetical protein
MTLANFANYFIACLLWFMLTIGATSSHAKQNHFFPLATATYPNDYHLYDRYPWAILYYYGVTGSDALGSMMTGTFHRWPEHIQSFEVSHTLPRDNWLRQFVFPLVGVVQVAMNTTIRSDHPNRTIYEFDPYIEGRWSTFPWNRYLNTSFAIGEGISYATAIPSLEMKSSNDTKRLLNYLLLEATIASPTYPQLQLVVRIHHRSGAYGLYHAGNTGSNNIGLSIRYLL